MTLYPLRPDLVMSSSRYELLYPVEEHFFRWYRPKRAPQPDFVRLLQSTLRVLLANLIRIHLAGDVGALMVPAGRDWYNEGGNLLEGKLTHASTVLVVEFLEKEAYVSRDPGNSSKSVSFRRPQNIRSLENLSVLFEPARAEAHEFWTDPLTYPIRLRESGNKAFVAFEITPEIERMRSKLAVINNSLMRHWTDLEITPAQHAEMNARIVSNGRRYSPFDLSNLSLYRVFNNGTFKDGGRFYGGWWQRIPSQYRRFIVIDGKHTVEVDYSAIHPTILYGRLGLEKPDDPYLLPIGHRNLVKATFNALINAGGPLIKPVDGFSEAKTGMPWAEFRTYVRNSFPMFERYFGTGYGLKLQRLDSDIAEAVMLDFAERGIPILPVHDSFIVHHGHQSLLDASMRKQFKTITGLSVGLKATAFNEENWPKAPGFVEVTHDLNALLNPQGPLVDSEMRLQQWFSSNRRDMFQCSIPDPHRIARHV